MNTSKQEVLKVLESIIKYADMVQDPDLTIEFVREKYGYLTNKFLQDNEDTEVQDRPTCPHTVTDLGMSSECVLLHDKPQFKPSSKVEKLKELQEEIGGGGYGKDYIHPMCDLIDILLEDEE